MSQPSNRTATLIIDCRLARVAALQAGECVVGRMQREERARIEDQIKAAEVATRMRAEEELKQQREKE
ncbi:transcription factor GTE12 [Senna tora]|uniref:Transcription factor GTE12 n=1 Tax=Senna tora TaxID=362788 RepID=A0A834T0I3_9FABA|nr:transcription factor GTE12 [Senna tora]